MYNNSSAMLPILVMLSASVLVSACLPLIVVTTTEESIDIQNSLSDGDTAAERDIIRIIPVVIISVFMLVGLLVMAYTVK